MDFPSNEILYNTHNLSSTMEENLMFLLVGLVVGFIIVQLNMKGW